MDASLLAVLTDAERLTVAETEAARLTALDEDAAIELETRIRRARDKYVGQYRRAASLRVPEQGGGHGAADEHPCRHEGRGVRGGPGPDEPPGRGLPGGNPGRYGRPSAR